MKSRKINYIALAPFITLGIYLVFYAIAGVFPFGKETTAFSDGVGQYLPFLNELSLKLKTGSSLFFTWHAGRGTNFWAVISYYLASPTNLIALLFPANRIDDAFALICLTKPVLMSLTFGIYYKNVYKKNDIFLALFSVLWAVSNFTIGALFFINWFDSLIYFPLVILGLKNLMDGKSGWFYSLFLALTVMSNFYIGWMVCIFCVLYFIYTFIADEDVVYEGVTAPNGEAEEESEQINIFAVFKNSYLLSGIFRFALASLVGGAITAVLSLPTVFALNATAKGQITNSTFNVKSIWGLLASHIFPLKNNYDTLGSCNYIFAYVGIITVFLCIAYFFNKNISKRKKIANAFLLVAFWTSIVFHAPYYIWHGFGEPVGLMYRFAQLYSFVLLKIAIECMIEYKGISKLNIILGSLFSFVCAFSIYQDRVLNIYFFKANIIIPIVIFILIYTALLFVMTKSEKMKKAVSIVMMLCVIGEVIALNYNNLNHRQLKGYLGEYSEVTKIDVPSGEYLNFARKDKTFNDIVNYGMLFGYNTNEIYSSMANGDFTYGMQDFGSFGNAQNAVAGAQEQTPIFNMFYPTKYYLDGTGKIAESRFRSFVKEENGYKLFNNNYTMPFMYSIPFTIDEWDPYAFVSPADEQIAAFKYITALDKKVLSLNEVENIQYENCEYVSNIDRREELYGDNRGDDYSDEYYEFLESRNMSMSCKIINTNEPAYFSFDSVAQNDGIMYFFVDITQFTDMVVTINGEQKEYEIFGSNEDRTYEIGEVKKGDIVNIKIGGYRVFENNIGDIYKTEYEIVDAIAYTVDMDVFEEGYNKLDSYSDTEMLEFSDTHVKAKVVSNIDGYLYIPTAYDEGWTITIDGQEVPLYEHESHILMTGISRGEHIVEMKYCPQGFVAGAVITGISLVILIAWAVISKKREREMNND